MLTSTPARALLAAALFSAAVALADAPPWKVPAAALKGLKNPVTAAGKDASVQRGQTFFAKECAGCHGDGGKGNGPDGIYFNTPPADLTLPGVAAQSDAELFAKITAGRGDMKGAEKTLDAAQRWDVVNYLRTLK